MKSLKTLCVSLSLVASSLCAGSVVEFIGMDAPSTPEKMAKAYSEAKVIIHTANGGKIERALSYETLFGVKDKVGTSKNPAGQLYSMSMKPLMDPFGKPLIAETPDSNSLLNVNGSLYLVTHYEYDWILSDGSSAEKSETWYERAPMSMTLTTIKQDAKNGKLKAFDQYPIDFSKVGGIWIPCAGSQTPWNTHLGSEEDYDLYFTAASGKEYKKAQKGLKAMSELYFEGKQQAKAYDYGYITEVAVKENSKTNVTKHYAMGRGTWEMAKIMSDEKTAFFGDDGAQVGLYMYVGDGAKDLDNGTLYAAIWSQTNEDGAKDGGQAKLSWIKLGHASSEEVSRWKEKLTFNDIFEAYAPAEFDPKKHEGFKAVKAGHSEIEYLKLKPNMERAAAFLETRRYAAYLGATTEFNKMEGVAFNKEDKKLYIAMSYIEKGMAKDASFAKDDIKVAKNRCGGTYEVGLASNIKDSKGELIASDFVPTNMSVPSALLGEEIATDALGNTCAVDKIANTDNLFYSSRARTLFIGEDSGTHVNNFVWAYNVDTKKLSRILSTPAGAESTGLQVVENMNGFAYIMSNAQHQGDFIKTMDKDLQSKVAPKIDKFQAPVGYIYGIPGL
ncbi:PhoX family protein [Sulfurospirillum halorespirans]|uniref:Putative phosphatase n=1 Tax=Sulfurospirillum halorespirans DSM 13726 TaxID=1193502 RepID=A0A1D7TGW3_9BACT|nr:alkaline phosphatase PhoX [Sulfurospirillum halorespirans]AOO64237.1 putative phosphatase [Sulfurospirillum halorespirans DSM 13726]